MTANVHIPEKQGTTEEVDAIDLMLSRMGENTLGGNAAGPLGQEESQEGLMRRAGNGQGAVEICTTAVPPPLVQKCHRLVAV